jgi:hypothetical protein
MLQRLQHAWTNATAAPLTHVTAAAMVETLHRDSASYMSLLPRDIVNVLLPFTRTVSRTTAPTAKDVQTRIYSPHHVRWHDRMEPMPIYRRNEVRPPDFCSSQVDERSGDVVFTSYNQVYVLRRQALLGVLYFSLHRLDNGQMRNPSVIHVRHGPRVGDAHTGGITYTDVIWCDARRYYRARYNPDSAALCDLMSFSEDDTNVNNNNNNNNIATTTTAAAYMIRKSTWQADCTEIRARLSRVTNRYALYKFVTVRGAHTRQWLYVNCNTRSLELVTVLPARRQLLLDNDTTVRLLDCAVRDECMTPVTSLCCTAAKSNQNRGILAYDAQAKVVYWRASDVTPNYIIRYRLADYDAARGILSPTERIHVRYCDVSSDTVSLSIDTVSGALYVLERHEYGVSLYISG